MSRRKLPWSTPTVTDTGIQLATATLSSESSLRERGPTTFIIGEIHRFGGRHPNFDPGTAKRLIAALEQHARKRMSELGHRPTRDDPELMRVVRRLIAVDGIDSSDKIIKRDIIAPVLRKLRGSK